MREIAQYYPQLEYVLHKMQILKSVNLNKDNIMNASFLYFPLPITV